MNTNKIKFVVGNIVKEIEVQSVYPYLTNSATSKVVLKISAKEEDADFDDIYALKTCTGVIEQYERTVTYDPENPEAEPVVGDWVLKDTLEGYNSGEISIGYQNGIYNADLTRVGKYERQVEQNAADIEYLSIIADIPLE